jgi:hypothetical protein
MYKHFATSVNLFSLQTISSVVPQRNVSFLDELLQIGDTVFYGRKPTKMNTHCPELADSCQPCYCFASNTSYNVNYVVFYHLLIS